MSWPKAERLERDGTEDGRKGGQNERKMDRKLKVSLPLRREPIPKMMNLFLHYHITHSWSQCFGDLIVILTAAIVS